ncbi:hypothetical protein QR680_010399 [Steinernema hermaphroditum]|uniref:Uncharacterized protein n=1 Tax=Steinernema hermaphroditum TaxID=289476 RepID=A0AA39IQ97_9BILA|nr:hypothetical protein QR680_010399 [Steinernema hermaphroditum]
MLWDLSGHLESDIKELWGTLMRCQPLEEVSFSFCKDVPLSVLKTADRRALPRLKELFLGDIQLNIDDFVHFLINVTHNVNSLVIMWKLQKEIRKVIQEGGGYRKFEVKNYRNELIFCLKRRVNDYGVLASLVVEIVFEVAQQLGCPGMANPHAIPFSALRCLAGMIWIGSSDPNALKLAKYLMMLICHLLAQNSLSLTILVVELMSKNGTNLTTSELTTLTPTTIAPTTVAPTTIASTTVAFAIFTRTTPAPHSLLSSIGYETEHEAM